MQIFSLFASYAGLGLFAGLLAGLLGVGGGLVIVPFLVALYSLQGFAPQALMQLAVGSSLATIVFTSLSSMRAHHRRGAVDWPVMLQLSTGILAGAGVSGSLAHWMGGAALAVVFGVFELAVALQLGFLSGAAAHRQAPGRVRNLVAGALIGVLSALLGIGGGTLTVPYLVWHNIDVRRAIGTSAACGLPIAAVGTLGFVWAGRQVQGLPDASSGYVYWPAVLAISAASVAAAPLGARLAHRLDRLLLRRLFALFLFVLGLWMIGHNLPANL